MSTPPIAERPWPNHGGGQRWSLTRSPLRQTVPPLMLRVPTIIMMKDTQPIHRWVLPQSSVGGRCVTCSRARVLPDFDRHSSFVDAGWAEFWHRTGALRAWADSLKAAPRGGAQPTSIAMIYCRLGDKERAFEFLEQGYQERTRGLVYLQVEPQYDPIRSDPRFQDMLARMNFPK